MTIEAVKTNKNNNIKQNAIKPQINTTLQGVLVNSHLRIPSNEKYTFSDIEDSLLINKSEKYYSAKEKETKSESSFNSKKAILPLLLGATAVAGGCFAFSTFLKKSSDSILKTKNFERLPDLAINMNIKEEPQFALYRAIRDPNFRNIVGATGVFLMSGITIACKNFVDGTKEIWVKKRSADIEKNLQENLIEVDRDTFSGKLKVVNDMMNENVKYFDKVINTKSEEPMMDMASFKQDKAQAVDIFEQFKTSFKGENTDKQNTKENVSNLKYVAMAGGFLIGGLVLGKLSLSNLRKTIDNAQNFANKYAENTMNAIETISEKGDKKDIQSIVELLKSICAKPNYIEEVGKKYNLSADEIKQIINTVEESKKTIFADAPTALGGIPKKVQYYCYIDEPRGHLYNWMLNPENKFTKYIFQAFTLSSAIGYLFKQSMDAVKEVTVLKENAKTDLDLKKRLVDVEIRNFKAKKESAINPLTDSFTKQAKEGVKSKKELKQIADNILMEIKNGPPYVYN